MKLYNGMKFLTLCGFCMLSSILESYAQQSFSLEQCMKMALEQNIAVQNSKLKLDMAQQGKKEAFTHYFPIVGLEGVGFKATHPMLPMDLGVGLPPINLFENGMAGAVVVRQPLYLGGKIRLENKLAELMLEGDRQSIRMSENEVLLEVARMYWELTYLYEQRVTLTCIKEQLTQLYKFVEVSNKAGLVNRNDLLKVDINLNELQSNELKLENGIELTKMAICQKMGMMGNYKDFEIPIYNVAEISMPEIFEINNEEAIQGRAENILERKRVEAKKLLVQMERANYLPNVSLGATLYSQNMIDKWRNNNAVFVSVSIPISGWWGGSYAIRKKKLEKKIAENSSGEIQQRLLLQLQKSKNDLLEAYQQIAVEKKGVAQSVENLRINEDGYKAGTISINDLLEAQSYLQRAKDKHFGAFCTYHYKLIEYQITTNQLQL